MTAVMGRVLGVAHSLCDVMMSPSALTVVMNSAVSVSTQISRQFVIKFSFATCIM